MARKGSRPESTRESPKVEEWRERLEHAHRYWVENGLIREMGSRPKPGSRDAFSYVDFYRGEQWDSFGWGGFEDSELITVNQTFANTKALIGKLSKRNPEPIVTPKRVGSDQSARARRNQLVLRYCVLEQKMKRQVDFSLRDALLGPFGIVQHGYTAHAEKYTEDGKEIEVYQMAKADWPWIRRRPWWDVRIDPLAPTFAPDDMARWCAFRDLLTVEQVKKHPRLTYPQDLRPTKSVDLLTDRRRQRKADADPKWYDLIEAWWIFDKTTREWACLTPGSRTPLMAPNAWPIPWEGLPYSYLAFNEQPDTNIPIPFPSTYEHQQIELNKVRTLMSHLVKSQRRLVGVSKDSVDETEKHKLQSGSLGMREVLLFDGDVRTAITEIPLGGFGNELLLYDAKIKEDIREIVGLSQMDRAQRANVESASESNAIQMGAAQISGPNEETFEDYWKDILRTYRQSLQYTMPDRVLMKIVSAKDAAMLGADDGFVNVSREDIQGEFDVDIRAGSTLPADHDRMFAKAAQLWQVFRDDAGVDQTEFKRTMLEEAGFDSTDLLLTGEALQQTQQILEQRGQAGAPGAKQNGKAAGLDANLMRQLGGGRMQ